jgi:plastocyanin
MKTFLIILGKGAATLTLIAGLAMWTGTHTPVAASAIAPPAGGSEIEISNFSFAPSTVTVPIGTQVTWTNKDEIGHNVVSADKSIKSKVLDTNDKFTFIFTKPGTYSYICTIHPRMKGTVVVQ